MLRVFKLIFNNSSVRPAYARPIVGPIPLLPTCRVPIQSRSNYTKKIYPDLIRTKNCANSEEKIKPFTITLGGLTILPLLLLVLVLMELPPHALLDHAGPHHLSPELLYEPVLVIVLVDLDLDVERLTRRERLSRRERLRRRQQGFAPLVSVSERRERGGEGEAEEVGLMRRRRRFGEGGGGGGEGEGVEEG